MRCPHCQHDNPAGARFCNACGGRLDGACPACGHANASGSRFCSQCGQALGTPPAGPRFASPQTYTPQHLAEKILTSRTALEGERKQVTVLFADLKGSLELLADRDPEDARALLDPVLKRMMEAVHRFEGTVNQVLGDGIMALFGAPVAHEDHAVRACYAALRMQESVSHYGDEVQRSYGIPLQIRVGLNSGEVVVRAIGSDLHMDYTAVGQTTHLAARIEQMAKPGSVLITADTLRLAEGYVQVKPLGPVPVKGLEAPIEVYELTGAQPVRSRLQAAAPRGLSPFVGRAVEMAELRRALDQARTGHGQVVALVGEPGVGKTRLFYELMRSAQGDGCLILESTAASYLTATPYQPLVDALKRYFELEDPDPPQAVVDRVTGKVLALDERLREAIPPVLWLFDVLPETDPLRAQEPPQRRARTLDAVKRLLLRQSRAQPLLLVFENLHWIDTETQAFLDTLVDSLPTSRVMLLVSYRPEYQHAWASRGYYTQLPIEPLPPDGTTALLRALLGDDRGLEPLTRLLAERTEGHPFFLEESVRRLVETRALTGSPGAYRLAKPLQAIKVPATVQAVVAARIDRLPPDEKRLLQAASVIGKDVALPLLQAIADLPEEELRRSLMHLQAAEFLHETNLFPELEYTFKHALTHDVAYGSLLQDRRRALHARIVAAIERLYGERLGDQLDRLAHHALQGELWEKAVVYLRQAGARAAERSANQEAVARFEQALAALRRLPETRETIAQGIDVRFELRPLLLQLGRLQELLSLSHEAERLAREIGDEPRLAGVYTYLINYHYLKGEPDRALEYGQRCLQIGEARNDLALQALARRYMGHSYHAQGLYRLAESVLRQNIEALEVAGAGDGAAQDNLSYVGSCAWMAFTLAELGEFNLAQGYLAKAQKAADASRHAYSQAIAWTLAGLVWARRGHLDGAVPLLDRSLETCREKHLPVWQPIPSALLGLTLVLLGRVPEGLPLLEDGVARSEELGIKAYLALWMSSLGEGLLVARQLERARGVAEQALELARAHKEQGHEAWALRLLGEIVAHGEPPETDRAVAYYERALDLADELGMRPLVARSHFGLGQLYRRAGNHRNAQAQLTTATALFCEMDMRFWVEQAWPELKELGRLFIVAQDRRGLYDYLTQMFAGDEQAVVILDRRQGERRLRAGPQSPDQRRGDRRAQSLPEDFPPRGFVIIAKP